MLIWGRFGIFDIPTILKFYITSGLAVKKDYMRKKIYHTVIHGINKNISKIE